MHKFRQRCPEQNISRDGISNEGPFAQVCQPAYSRTGNLQTNPDLLCCFHADPKALEFLIIWGSLEVARDPIWLGSSIYRKGLWFLVAFQACPFTLRAMRKWTFCLHLSRVLGGKPLQKPGIFFSEKSWSSSIVWCTIVWKIRKKKVTFLLHCILTCVLGGFDFYFFFN